MVEVKVVGEKGVVGVAGILEEVGVFGVAILD